MMHTRGHERDGGQLTSSRQTGHDVWVHWYENCFLGLIMSPIDLGSCVVRMLLHAIVAMVLYATAARLTATTSIADRSLARRVRCEHSVRPREVKGEGGWSV
jgi:hypothetical protein